MKMISSMVSWIVKFIYMEQPQGFISREFPYHVCQIKKALYGLKQAPRAWYGQITQYLSFCGFNSSSSDTSSFVKFTSSMYIVLLLYVDDMIITGDNNAEITQLHDELSIRFETKKSRRISFLSWIRNSQDKLLTQFGMRDSTLVATPMEP